MGLRCGHREVELPTPLEEFPNTSAGSRGFRYVNKWVLAAVPDVHYAIEDMIAEGDMVACRVTCSGTHEGKLVERWGVRDDLGMIQQLGVMPAPEQLE